ncbi:hypothetical protein CRENBAI_021212 [Crenichthys baileyi]|uniref:Uncharacterized protein n=1 Tax=Crenichthys baileyi TaxID=28760 RepID=A0AAV9REN5_9TELE
MSIPCTVSSPLHVGPPRPAERWSPREEALRRDGGAIRSRGGRADFLLPNPPVPQGAAAFHGPCSLLSDSGFVRTLFTAPLRCSPRCVLFSPPFFSSDPRLRSKPSPAKPRGIRGSSLDQNPALWTAHCCASPLLFLFLRLPSSSSLLFSPP